MKTEINALWIGDSLGLMEKLTIKSFVDIGHTFNLYAYSKNLDQQVPRGTILLNACQIIPKEKIFCYKGAGDCRSGSYGGFSDLFRYELLYKKGGWYVDMDVTCVNTFDDFKQEYVIRPHHKTEIVGNIIKVPKQSKWMDLCRKETWKTVDENNDDWHKPIEILRKNFHICNLEKYVVSRECFGDDGTDDFDVISQFYNHVFYPNISDVEIQLMNKIYPLSYNKIDYFKCAIHWMNEANKYGTYRNKFDWNRPRPRSIYAKILKKFKLYGISI